MKKLSPIKSKVVKLKNGGTRTYVKGLDGKFRYSGGTSRPPARKSR